MVKNLKVCCVIFMLFLQIVDDEVREVNTDQDNGKRNVGTDHVVLFGWSWFKI